MTSYSKLAKEDCNGSSKKSPLNLTNASSILLVLLVLLQQNTSVNANAWLGVTIALLILIMFPLLPRLINPFGFFGPMPFPGALPFGPVGMGGFGMGGWGMGGWGMGGWGMGGFGVFDDSKGPMIAENTSFVTTAFVESLPSRSLILQVKDLLGEQNISAADAGNLLSVLGDSVPVNLKDALETSYTVVDGGKVHIKTSVPSFYPSNGPIALLNSTEEVMYSVTSFMASINVTVTEFDYVKRHNLIPASENATRLAETNCPKGYKAAYTTKCVSECPAGTQDVQFACMSPCKTSFNTVKKFLCMDNKSFDVVAAQNKCTQCPDDPRIVKIGCNCVTLPTSYIRSVTGKHALNN